VINIAANRWHPIHRIAQGVPPDAVKAEEAIPMILPKAGVAQLEPLSLRLRPG